MRKFVLIMLAVSLAVAGGISYFASPHPDGLERVAEKLGFLNKADAPSHSVLPDYTVPGLEGFLSNGLAGIIGVLATFGVTVLLTRLVKREKAVSRRDAETQREKG
jgi:cobalt/nickel transport protein